MAKFTINVLMYPGDAKCMEAHSLINDKVLNKYHDMVDVNYLDYDSVEGQELVRKYNNSSFPYVLIEDDLFSTGKVDIEALVKEIKTNVSQIKTLEKGEE